MDKTYLYYPGCTLKTKAKELDAYALQSMEMLGIPCKELDEWQCCGAVYPQATDEIATRLSAARALEEARQKDCDLLTLCSACHHVMKRVNHDIASDADIRMKVNNYSEFETPYAGETKVVHFLEMLRDTIGFAELKKRVLNPLTGRKIGAYYGCLLLRPSNVMQFDDPENPYIMEEFLHAIGAEPVLYSYRNECCGGYVALDDPALVQKVCTKVLHSAEQKGAEVLVTACPLCKYNLTKHDSGDVPTYYFTELLAEALGVKE
ncbi:MAG: CoB--CoM heterodisulfide reductase iron-sulfur subunit B family protein [Oscillospiraceae bacterium]|nr:CoB--CoM heterodisulfide reductase iron-sulfur subunit B family protein [Oscillospiraceae bacterium]